MSRFFPASVGVFALAVLLPAVGQSQNTKPAADDPAVMRAKYLAGNYVTGKIAKLDLDGDVKKLTVKVSWQTKVLDDDAKKKYDDAVKNYQTAVQQKNRGNITKFGQEAQKLQGKLYKDETQSLDLDFVCEKDIKVRKSATPPKDAATLKDLENDQSVKVTIDRIRANKMKKEELEPGHPITFIQILPDAPAKAGAAKTN